jgi:hypothetical protein
VAARRLAAIALLAAAPDLAARPLRLAALAPALVAALHPAAGPAHAEAAPMPLPQGPMPPPAAAAQPVPATPVVASTAAAPAPVAPDQATPRVPHAQAALLMPTPAAAAAASPPADAIAIERASRAAGVLLTLRALDRMGIGAWIARTGPAPGFGRALLRHIAARARHPPDDPLFALLPGVDDAADAAALAAFRVGLDRWLRRRVRRRLCDLARRGGALLAADTTLHVRFPPDAADLRLRRAALDVDPGWLPWLGLAVRYHYRDEPLR